jgi:hypothetical protein
MLHFAWSSATSDLYSLFSGDGIQKLFSQMTNCCCHYWLCYHLMEQVLFSFNFAECSVASDIFFVRDRFGAIFPSSLYLHGAGGIVTAFMVVKYSRVTNDARYCRKHNKSPDPHRTSYPNPPSLTIRMTSNDATVCRFAW